MEFAGWQMPFCYTSPGEEHLSARRTGGLFDVSHLGQLRVRGKNSLPFLQGLIPTNIQNLKVGQACYSVFCNSKGGLIDDLIIYCCSREDYLLCVNFSAKKRSFPWMKSFAVATADVEVTDESAKWGLIAVQGPRAFELCEKAMKKSFTSLKKFHFTWFEDILASRTGYTGEKGVELYIPWKKTPQLWSSFLEKGRALHIRPVGLGARDTLRLEMAYLLSGQDFDETRTPLSAGLSWLMTNPGDYVGKKEAGRLNRGERLYGFIVEEPSGIPRKGCSVVSEDGEPVGIVTSGAKSPSLEKMIGLAYIKERAESCFVDIHGSSVKIKRMRGPFLNLRKEL